MRQANAATVTDQAVRSEIVVLGTVLLNDSIFPQTLSLRPDDFAVEAHRLIYRRMRDLFDTGKPIDVITVAELLFRHKELERIGGMAYISELSDGGLPRSSIAVYVEFVRTYAGRRRIALVSSAISDEAHTNPGASIAQLRSRLVRLDDEASKYDNASAEDGTSTLSDDALALKFTAQHGDNWQFTAAWGRWNYWNGRC